MNAFADLRFTRTGPARARAQSECDVLENRHVTKQGIVLKHKADVAFADLARQRILPVETDLPLVRPFETGDDPQQRCLAGARWTQQRDQLARVDVEADVLERGEIALKFLLTFWMEIFIA